MLPGIKQFDLSGRVALVTGGSKGLGSAMAAGLASAGANVVLSSRHRDEVEQAAKQIQADHGTQALGLAADVVQPGDVERLVTSTLERFGKIDILINNAGINIRGPIDELSFEQFKQVHDINVDGL